MYGCQQGDRNHVIVTCGSRRRDSSESFRKVHSSPLISPMPQQPADSDDEFPDDIGQLDLSNVPGLQEIPIASSIRPSDDPSPPPTVIVSTLLSQSPASSLPSEYDCDDEIDESTIAALDALEAQFVHGQPRLGGQSLVH
jgi:hypothetical protein